MSKYDDLIKKLREIFQIDRPELDFGIYRILNIRVSEINNYLENRLKAKVSETLSASRKSAGVLSQAKEHHHDGDSDSAPKIAGLKEKVPDPTDTSAEHENIVFSHLLTFFSRYYESGDFVSQRRYKGNTYAIPYAGEEEVLHWANKDQYYTKNGENFSNYGFKLDDGRTVRFQLVAADTAKDNRKDDSEERRFVLIEPQSKTFIDEDGEEFEETLVPVKEITGENGDELIVSFEYKAMPKGTKQEVLVSDAVKKILQSSIVKARWLALESREPTEKNPQRNLLEKCLTNYTNKNTADYFIHKNLGVFLRSELDFYIKNEVMHLDDLQNTEDIAEIGLNLRVIQTLRSIALELITFLAQLEDFQKKLWLKKKFVVGASYCLTLDRVPESLFASIAANSQQWEQWQKLGLLDGSISDPPVAIEDSIKYLKAHPHLMIDTSLFDIAFKSNLLANLDDLDETLDGLLIHGDNFQALNLLSYRYREQIKCVYIDPPYNTGNDGFCYKDNSQRSSWLTMLENRIEVSNQLMSASDSFLAMSIDKRQMYDGKMVLDCSLTNQSFVNGIVVVNNPKGRSDQKHLPTAHDNILLYATTDAVSHGWSPSDKVLKRYRKQSGDKSYREIDLRKTGDNDRRVDRPNMFYPFNYNEVTGELFPSRDVQNIDGFRTILPMKSPLEEGRWRWELDTSAKNISRLVARHMPNKNQWTIFEKDFLGDDERVFPTSVWDEKGFNSERGTELFVDMGFKKEDFPRPKPIKLLEYLLEHLNRDGLFTLDYFAGSGTTGHAVINLNRADNGKRRYIMVEQGEYFDTVTKPRIQKAVYSADWSNGKPTKSDTGLSHAFKVLRIESYEDSLNNLRLIRTEQQKLLLASLSPGANDDYLLNYLLDIESRDSLLTVKVFDKPFDYKLKVAVDSAGACDERNVDLMETFNYLIGLRVNHIDMQLEKGFVTITGWLPTNEKTLVLWRDVEKVDYETLNRLCSKLSINPADSEFEIVYINGDHNIPSVFTSSEADGGMTKTLKIRQIEQEFLDRMFATEIV